MLNKKLKNNKRNSEEGDVVLKNQQMMVRVQQMKKTAGALSIDDVISSDITISRNLMFTSICYLKLAIAKRCRSNKLERQRFAFALRISRGILRW
ncbi:hypothetical protein F511_23596 [Dorcoceras hygrometricum]|uniref:Uncharacterized protein n=1 Tax=Dorcoceras hygrometricum TaxID=472368 RepID=A0A2Z7BWF3_9LAMI|nr:hypothetical protein F511_23596 [Dorcoceras hygrometricum]